MTKEEGKRVFITRRLTSLLLFFFFSFFISSNFVLAKFGYNEIRNDVVIRNYYNYTINATEVYHNNLSGLQGGSFNERYHLTKYFHDLVVNKADSWIDNAVSDLLNYFTKSEILGFKYYNDTFFPYTHLSNFTDDLGNRGYTSLSNFTNDVGYWNDTYATFNKTYADTLYAPISEPLWTGNYSNVAFINKANSFGAFNQSFNTNTLFIDATNGRVGVGTTSPQGYGVHVHTTNTWTGIKFTTQNTGSSESDGGRFGYDDSVGQFIWNRENSNIVFATNNAEKVRITNTGNVGIGTTNPSGKLQVSGGNAIFDGNVGIGTTSPGASLDIVSVSAGIDKGLRIRQTTDPNQRIRLWGSSTPDAGYLTFGDGTGWKFHFAKDSDSGATKFMTIQDNGNVGIGTTSPGYKLDIQGGNIRIGGLTAPGIYFDSTNGGVSGVNYIRSPDDNYIQFNAGHNKAAGHGFRFTIDTDQTEVMRIEGNGNVGIGTTTPSQKLDVNGSVIFRGDLDMNSKNVTAVNCIVFSNGASWCGT
ncbi:MAG: hypothetical protein QXU40_00975 [Candidatus Pacearchaeota archaeon]